jgi:ABC-type histidine transport system ATPase subunit
VTAIRRGGAERNHIYFFYHLCLNLYDAPDHAGLTISKKSTDKTHDVKGGEKKKMANDKVKRIRSTLYLNKDRYTSRNWGISTSL